MIFKNTIWQVKTIKTDKIFSGRLFRVIDWTDKGAFVSLGGFYTVEFLDNGEEIQIRGMDMRKNAKIKEV